MFVVSRPPKPSIVSFNPNGLQLFWGNRVAELLRTYLEVGTLYLFPPVP
jgi:hypothetical protein